jgi:hypothetical protein
MSSATSVNEALRGYAAGRVSAQQLVEVVAAAHYGERGAGSREQLRPLIEIIERAHPGIVELSGSSEKPGFGVRLAERPFPKRFEAELRQAVEGLVTAPRSLLPAPSLFSRIVRAIRRAFSA